MAERLAAGKARATVNREPAALRLRAGRRAGSAVHGAPVKLMAENNARQGFVTSAHFEPIVAALPEYVKDVTRFGFLVGWRRGEVVSLEWDDVDLEGHRIKDFRDVWENACKAAGRPALLFHDLRRSAVRNLVDAGVDQVVAMRITGHQTASVFQRYRIASDDDVRAALERTPGERGPAGDGGPGFGAHHVAGAQ